MYRSTQFQILKADIKYGFQPKFLLQCNFRRKTFETARFFTTNQKMKRNSKFTIFKMKMKNMNCSISLQILKNFKAHNQDRNFSTNKNKQLCNIKIDNNNSNSNSNNNKQQQQQKKQKTRWFRLGFLPKPFSLDKIVGLLQLLFVFPGLLILAATTTVVGIILWVINRSEKWQEWTNYYVSVYLSRQTGCVITFKNALHSWKEGTIKLKDVSIVRDPKQFPPDRDRNTSAIFLRVESVDVQISLLWWIQGNGWLKEVRGNGVRGYIDRRHLRYPETWTPPKRKWKRGSLHLTKFILTDVQISLFNPNPKREIPIVIYTLDCNRLRQQWLLFDLLSSNNVDGTFDNCLFTLRQSSNILRKEDTLASFLKIHGLPFDLVSSTSATGPISWITEGIFDLEVDLHFVDEYSDSEHETHSSSGNSLNHLQLDFRLTLKNLHASVPLKPKELSYLNAALVHPVVAYLNTNYTSIPLEFSLKIPKSEFDGAWTPDDVRLVDKISEAVAAALVVLVNEQKKPSNIQKHLLRVVLSFKRGIFFLWRQLHAQYQLWSFNNDEEWSKDSTLNLTLPLGNSS